MSLDNPLSRLRLRKIRTLKQRKERPVRERRLLESTSLRTTLGVLTLALCLWWMRQSGSDTEIQQLLARGTVLTVVVFGGQSLLKVIASRRRPMPYAWLLMLLMIVASLGVARGVSWLLSAKFGAEHTPTLVSNAVPHAFAPLLVSMLFGGPAALVIGLVCGVALALWGEANLGVLLLALCATAVAALEGPRLRQRSQILGALWRIALWQTPVALAMGLLAIPALDLSALGEQLLLMYAMLLFSGLAAIWLLPLVERLTGTTSQITLNLLADLGHPLLRRLALDAPGTYHHSLLVATLAESAAESIGANGLLARVGGYYHDIGKLARARYYVENQSHNSNPHDALPPNISRMIISNHVKEGLCLGRLYRLPPPVINMIAMHHGTSVIRSFHHKAVTQLAENGSGDDSAADEDHYRYAGPLAVDRETTILALADPIEAASRAMPTVTPTRIKGLVDSVIRSRWLDGQLNNSQLSNADLDLVRHSFCQTLTHLLHARLAYPADKNEPDNDPEQSATLPAEAQSPE